MRRDVIDELRLTIAGGSIKRSAGVCGSQVSISSWCYRRSVRCCGVGKMIGPNVGFGSQRTRKLPKFTRATSGAWADLGVSSREDARAGESTATLHPEASLAWAGLRC